MTYDEEHWRGLIKVIIERIGADRFRALANESLSRKGLNGACRQIPIHNLKLSTRITNCIDNENAYRTGKYERFPGAKETNAPLLTVGDLDDLSDGELLRLPNFGRHSLREVRKAIGALKEVHESAG